MLEIRQIVVGIRRGLREMPRTSEVRFDAQSVCKFVRAGGKTTKQVAEHFSQSPQKALAMLRRLCDDGQVQRNDGRVIVWS